MSKKSGLNLFDFTPQKAQQAQKNKNNVLQKYSNQAQNILSGTSPVAQMKKLKAKHYITVSQLQNEISKNIRNNPQFQRIYLRGGVTKINKYKWVWYVDIDDPKQKNCSMSIELTRRVFTQLPFKLQVGKSIDIVGRLFLSRRYNANQIRVESVLPAGISTMYLKLMQTKHYLQKNGYFAEDHKQVLPKFPQRIAVVTSKQGAVIRDIIETARARDPLVQIVLLPTSLANPRMMVKQLRLADAPQKHFDTIILGRGGGSKKDLQPFNDKQLAITIYNCSTPVVTSIGHGIDHTIADDVADCSVVTPTKAADVSTPDLRETKANLDSVAKGTQSLARGNLKDTQQQVTDLVNHAFYLHPQKVFLEPRQVQAMLLWKHSIDTVKSNLNQYQQSLNQLHQQQTLQLSPQQLLTRNQLQVKIWYQKIHLQVKNFIHNTTESFQSIAQYQSLNHKYLLKQMKDKITKAQNMYQQTQAFVLHNLTAKQQQLNALIQQLQTLAPSHTMKRGYIYASNSGTQQIVNKIQQVKTGQKLALHVLGGTVQVKVLEKRKHND